MPSLAHPLSFAQQRLWFLDQLSPGLPHYNVPLAFDVDGAVDLDVLRDCLSEVVRQHEALRTVFTQVDGVPQQHVMPHRPLDLPVHDVSGVVEAEREAQVEALIQREVRRPFDLSTGPVFRASVIRVDPVRHVLILAIHHIAFDDWSGGVIFRDLAACYDAFSSGRPSPLTEPKTRYVDFARYQRAWMDSEAFARQLAYWREQLRAPRPALAWATDRPRPSVPTHTGYRVERILPESTLEALRQLGRRDGVTPFMIFTAAYAAFLHRLTGDEDVLIGTPIANRGRQEFEPVVGFFLNSLVLRIAIPARATFRELLTRVRRVAIDAYSNQELPFERLVEELKPERTQGPTPLAQTFLVVHANASLAPAMAIGDVILRRRPAPTGSVKFDAQFAIWPSPQRRRAVLDLSADLFEHDSAERLLGQFCHLLDDLPAHLDEPLDRISIVSARAQRGLVESWNRTDAPVAVDSSLVDLFTARVEATPGADAVLWGEERVSYADLDARARRLASALRAQGVAPGDRVGLVLSRTPDLVASALAVLMVGAAYVPLDPDYPAGRLKFVAADAGCRVVLTQDRWLPLAAELASEPLTVESIDDSWAPDAGPCRATPTSLAYVIYTSGSTGTPKGVAIEHRHVVNLVGWACATFHADERAGMLASTSMSFDLSVFEWFVPLCSGGTIVLVDTLLALPDAPARHRVTFVNSVPSVVRELLRKDDLPSTVSIVAMAGEALPQPLVAQVYRQASVKRVFDLYGPTETTVYATSALRTADGPETIGRPIANTSALVLDADGALAPVGVAGELFIGGAGVGRGYLGRDDLTSERFVQDPVRGVGGGRMYRTGDRARWRSDGSLEFLGRLDRQVKIRGFRIELGEVEAALRAHAGVAEAVVFPADTDKPERARLVACVVPHGDVWDERAIYVHLEARLPHYMVPTRIDRLEVLPRLPNGKVDLRALEDIVAAPRAERATSAPRNAAEKAIFDVWRGVLDVPSLGVDDNFFRLGGHSLLATQLVVRLNRRFGTALDTGTVFSAPTIAEQAQLIGQHQARQRASATAPDAVVESPASELTGAWHDSMPAATSHTAAPGRTAGREHRPLLTRARIEARVAAIWKALLEVESFGYDDSFFDLGGHSLLAMRVLSRLRSEFQVDLDLRTLFLSPTVTGLAAAIEELSAPRDGVPGPIAHTPRRKATPLSYSQQRIWFLQRWYGDVGVYNVPAAFRLEGPVDIDGLRQALQTIVDRHESLRTVFPLVDGLPVQRIDEAVTLPFDVIDLSHRGAEAAAAAAQTMVHESSRQPFDLANGPLIRATVLRVAATTTVLVVTLHHIVTDGWSMGVLFRELSALYRPSGGAAPDLPALPVQYADFAEWQREFVAGDAVQRQLDYWRERLRAPIGTLDWPMHRTRPDDNTAHGGRIGIALSPEASDAVARLASSCGATLFMTTLAALQALLHRYTGQRDILVGAPVANRMAPEVEALIGCFINTLVMRGDVAPGATFRQLVAEARRTSIDAQSNQDVPFELVVERLNVKRSASHAPLFQAMLVVNDGLAPPPALRGLHVSGVPFRFDYAKFDISIELRTTAGGIRGALVYNADLFSADYAQMMTDDFVGLLRHAVEHPDRPLSEVPLAGPGGFAGVDRGAEAAPPAQEDVHDPDAMSLEERLQPLWRRVLDVEEIGPHDNFFDLGGTSLRAVRLFADLEQAFGLRIPLSSLFRNGTIRDQARLIVAQQRGRTDWSVLVPLQPLGSRPPLFLVHGIGGEVLSFGPLVNALGADQPVYGLQAEYESPDWDDRLESVASRYVAAMRAKCPSGPYMLGGYSSGGVVAFEMAHQLAAAGEEVGLLAMIDTSAPKTAAQALTPQALWHLVKNAAYWTLDDEFLRSDWADRRARVSAKLRALRAKRRHASRRAALDAGADVRDLLGLWKVPAHARRFLERYVRMMAAYTPTRYAGTVTLLRARTVSLTYLGAEDFGWGQLARRVVVSHVPGAHDSILREPRVRDLAAAFSTHLQGALSGTDVTIIR